MRTDELPTVTVTMVRFVERHQLELPHADLINSFSCVHDVSLDNANIIVQAIKKTMAEYDNNE